MCGIVGIFSFEGSAPFRRHWSDLVNHLFHRGPDEGAWWSDGPFFLGHRRLSIIDLTTGQQPMATQDGQLVVTFNGEIYNYHSVRSELEQLGHVFATGSDTEVLLHGYREWGTDLPRHLVGMFAFALADRSRHELYLARDRFGEKPLLYVQTPRYLAFASELRPLAGLPDLDRQLDMEALGGFLSLNYVPGGKTLMRGVHRVEPGSWLKFGRQGRHAERYWRPPIMPPMSSGRDVSLPALEAEWQSNFDRAVRLSLVSDVPVGILLSGGIDSSLVAESAMRQGGLSRAYVLDFNEVSYSEYDAAHTVANRLGLPLDRVPLTANSLQNFLELVEHADEPLADSSAVAVWTVTQHAARRNKVVLGGDGGDELFLGYLTYLASRCHAHWMAKLPRFIRRQMSRVSSRIPVSENKVSATYKLWRFLRAAELPTSLAHLSWNGTWLPSDAARIVRQDSRDDVSSALPHLLAQYPFQTPLSINDLRGIDLQEYLPNDILAKTDRISMAHSLEVRAPFLERDFAMWALQLPASVNLTRRGALKAFLRHIARKQFGPEIADRKKQGFSIPIHAWLRGPLAEPIRELLSPASLAPLEVIDAQHVSKLLELHLSGRRAYGFELWGLAVLVAWHQVRIQRPPTAPLQAPLVQRNYEQLSHSR
jgi:asparagine synthase (glutamine-hydrolysing)